MKKQRQKITLIIEGVYPWYKSGVSEWAYRYLTTFSDTNFRIIQVATDHFKNADYRKALYPIPSNVTDFHRVQPPTVSSFRSSDSDLKKWIQSLDLPDFSDSDSIQVLNAGLAGWLGLSLSKSSKKPLFLLHLNNYSRKIEAGSVTIANGFKLEMLGLPKNEWHSLFESMAEEVVRSASMIICSNPGETENLKSKNKNTHYIPCGIDESWLITSKLKNYDSEHLIIGWIGQCSHTKNPLKFFELIDAFKKWKTNTATFKMMLLESGEFELTEQILERSQDYPELELIWNKPTATYIEKMDAVCFTSLYESFPLILVEANAKKVLPFGWNCGDLPNELGAFEPMGALPETVAYRILSLRRKKQEWDAIVEKNYQTISEKYLWKTVFSEYRLLIEKNL